MSLLPRFMMGKKAGVMALEISQPGSNVLTCDPEEMLLSSLLDVASAIETGTVTVANGGTVVVPFDFGGVPFVSFQVVVSGYALIPAMYANYGHVWVDMDDEGATFHNNSGASRVVNYQFWNKELF